MRDEILALTKKLVSIGSVNTTPGEKAIGCYIEEYLRSIPYFEKHPERVIIQELKEDALERRNVIAWIKGEKGNSKKTILFHGHTDTVGIEDYGRLKEYAFDCDQLMEEFRKIELPKEVREDLESGEYLFGRGACDMKSGDAVFLVLARHICEKLNELEGNIILSFNPVEENLHTGIIEAREIFEKLKQEEGLEYILAINNDYICPLYLNDPKRYVYTGSVGKLLPCFYIQGKETHVGQCFEGFDASLVAAELVKEITLNPDFCEAYKGEYTLPPSVLKMKDLKKQYNVQTSFSSFLYFNYFVHNASMQEIMKKLRAAAMKSLEAVEDLINARNKSFCQMTNQLYKERHYDLQVLDYQELVNLAKQKSVTEVEGWIAEKTAKEQENGTDKREIPMRIVEGLCNIADIKEPTIVIFFAAPYCPHNTLKTEIVEEKALYHELSEIIGEFAEETGEDYQILQFFPSLTDSSYLKIDDDMASIQMLKANFPSYEALYNVPLEAIKALNIPGINYGCYGKDAHKWTERVYMPYSYEVLPKLIMKTIDYFLTEKEHKEVNE